MKKINQIALSKPKIIDLFSGIGGFSLAGEWAGFETIGFCEKDNFCSRILKKHWPNVINYGDIKTLDATGIKADLITGGFPCQPFSSAGKKKGIFDERYLWTEFYRIICSVRPTWILAENVTGIVAVALEDILIDLEKAGYKSKSFIIPACASNAPHRRDRVWIVAHINSFRGNSGIGDRKQRHIQKDEKRDLEKIKQKWTQLIPHTWSHFTAGNWLQYNAIASRRNHGIPGKLDKPRLKSLGNAIVPQIAYVFLSLIKNSLMEQQNE